MSDLDLIKQKIDIVSFISEYVGLKKAGINFKGLCPFHAEKTPSFIVSPERQIWHCFGGCQDGGDIFRFLMRVENIEFPEALKILAKRAGVALTSYQPTKTTELRERIFAANHLASEFFHYILTSHPLGQKGRDYLQNRQITENSIKLFRLGYAPNSWDSLIKFLAKKGYPTVDLEAAGLVSKSGIGRFFDRFRGRLMFTLCDHRGNVAGFAGRLLDPNATEAKYINTSETPVYTKGNILYALDTTREEIRKNNFAVVVEGEIDAIQSYQAGIRNVVAIKGSALTAGHVALLKRYTENIYLSLDADFAGDAAAHRGIQIADEAGLNIKVVTFSGAKDPDELIKKDPALWRAAIEAAVPFYDYIIDSAVQKFDPADALGAKQIIVEAAKFLGPIDNLVVKNHYLKKLAEKIAVPQDVVENQLDREYKKLAVTRGPATAANPKPAKGRSELLEEYLLSLLLQAAKPSDYLLLIAHRLGPEDFTNTTLGEVYRLLVALPGGNFNIQSLTAAVPPELQDLVDRLYLQENTVDREEDAAILAEIQKTVWEIRELHLRSELKKIADLIRQKPDSPDLEQAFAAITTALRKLSEDKKLLEQKP
jgi:DNA primase